MTAQLFFLALAGLLQGLQFALVAIPANLQLGTDVTTAPRDDGPLESKVSNGIARLARALNNHFEALILFTIAVVLVELTGTGSAVTGILAFVYFVARVLYVPAYYYGWTPWRSAIWAVGFLATMLMILIALLGGMFMSPAG